MLILLGTKLTALAKSDVALKLNAFPLERVQYIRENFRIRCRRSPLSICWVEDTPPAAGPTHQFAVYTALY